MNCCCREGIERQFDSETARKELRRLRRRGPIRSTMLLIEALRADGVAGASILDIGGGVGAVHHELLDAGAREAVHVDIAPAYLEAAAEEAGQRGHAERVRFVDGDFVERADELPEVDIVTLDRVICCYPDMPRLVVRSAEKARRLYGAVYPRDTRLMRFVIAAVNVILRLRRTAFRVYLHPPAAIEALLADMGFELRFARLTFAWRVAVYRRDGRLATPSAPYLGTAARGIPVLSPNQRGPLGPTETASLQATSLAPVGRSRLTPHASAAGHRSAGVSRAPRRRARRGA